MPTRKRVAPDKATIVVPSKEEAAEAGVDIKELRQFVLYESAVDKFNTKRTRVELTPATCEQCGLDLAWLNELPSYDGLSESQQADMREGLRLHVLSQHTMLNQRVVDEDDIPRSWLGAKNEEKLKRGGGRIGHNRLG